MCTFADTHVRHLYPDFIAKHLFYCVYLLKIKIIIENIVEKKAMTEKKICLYHHPSSISIVF